MRRVAPPRSSAARRRPGPRPDRPDPQDPPPAPVAPRPADRSCRYLPLIVAPRRAPGPGPDRPDPQAPPPAPGAPRRADRSCRYPLVIGGARLAHRAGQDLVERRPGVEHPPLALCAVELGKRNLDAELRAHRSGPGEESVHHLGGVVLLAALEVDHAAVEAEPDRAPHVLLDQARRRIVERDARIDVPR